MRDSAWLWRFAENPLYSYIKHFLSLDFISEFQ